MTEEELKGIKELPAPLMRVENSFAKIQSDLEQVRTILNGIMLCIDEMHNDLSKMVTITNNLMALTPPATPALSYPPHQKQSFGD